MKTILPLLLLAGVLGLTTPTAQAGPEPAKKATKITQKRGLARLFAPRQQESAYAKAMRRNELLR